MDAHFIYQIKLMASTGTYPSEISYLFLQDIVSSNVYRILFTLKALCSILSLWFKVFLDNKMYFSSVQELKKCMKNALLPVHVCFVNLY